VILKKLQNSTIQRALLEHQDPANKEMLRIQSKIPIANMAEHLLLVFPLIPHKSSRVEEDNGGYMAFELKTRVVRPSDATKYKKFVRKFKEVIPQE
jgi:hypothetical protein